MTTTPQPIARALAEFACALSPAALPDALRRKATHHITDALGLGFAARHYPFASATLAGIAAAGAPGESTVIGEPAARALAPRDAALANGFLMHGLDFDDTHPLAIVHPTVACLPAALALGEALDADWDDVLTAYVAGMETAIRLGVAVKGGLHHAGFHATGIVSHFSSAVVAGKLIGLDAAQLTAAQGIVASTAAGVQVFLEEGAWTKRLHPGWGALAGITAAHLAKHGFAGPSRPYEGRFALFDSHLQAHADDVDLASITRELGETWTMEGTAIKPYPVCHFIHGCAEAALRLNANGLNVDDIESIVCRLPAPTLPIVAEPAAAKALPKTDYEAKFSTHFVVAACLQRGRFGLAELEDAVLQDRAILALAAKVRCEAQQECDFPRYFSGEVIVTMRDGSTHHEQVPVNLGSGERALDAQDIETKFRGTAGLTLSQDRVNALLDMLMAGGKRKVRAITKLLQAA